MPFQLTLRFRIITLISLFAIFLIAAFTTLLITRQLNVITENNQYRARVGTFAAKGAFERTLLSTVRAGDPQKAFQRLIPLLEEGDLAEDVMVANPNGKVVASTRSYMVGTYLSSSESRYAEIASQSYSPKNWFRAEVEPGEIIFFAPITLDDVPQYVGVFRYSLGNMGEAIRQAGGSVLLVAVGLLVLVVPLCLLLIKSILGPIRDLDEATQDIAAGNLGRKVEVETEDELGDLAETFNGMTTALVQMKQRAENANPLTRLPGNNMIHEAIEKRLKAKKKFVAVYSDLDNFKAFNDKYGIGAGDKAIKLTAAIMRESMRKGASDDFLGHEGGDDFFLLTVPEKSEPVTQHICDEFDKRVRQFYSEEDQKQGFIMSKDREGNVKQFPIMTISLAGVTNARRELTSYAEITNICAEIKKKAKLASKGGGKSCFVVDQRGADRGAEARGESGSAPQPPPQPPPA